MNYGARFLRRVKARGTELEKRLLEALSGENWGGSKICILRPLCLCASLFYLSPLCSCASLIVDSKPNRAGHI
jgi:hypothetical protein